MFFGAALSIAPRLSTSRNEITCIIALFGTRNIIEFIILVDFYSYISYLNDYILPSPPNSFLIQTHSILSLSEQKLSLLLIKATSSSFIQLALLETPSHPTCQFINLTNSGGNNSPNIPIPSFRRQVMIKSLIICSNRLFLFLKTLLNGINLMPSETERLSEIVQPFDQRVR